MEHKESKNLLVICQDRVPGEQRLAKQFKHSIL
jgi:hypothetical protein